MQQFELDLGTRLDWDIVLRGKDDHGAALAVSRDYIGRGMRARASQLATRWLGASTKREIEHSRQRETVQDRLPGPDHAQSTAERDGVIDLDRVTAALDWRRHRALVLGRLLPDRTRTAEEKS